MNIIKKTTTYIEYLKNNCSLIVSVHIRDNIFENIPSHIAYELLKYNCHTNVYCAMVKSHSFTRCIDKQNEFQKKCQITESFCDICYAGVCQIIYPVKLNGESAGFVAVSGYRKDIEETKNIINYNLWKESLSDKIPVDMCNVLIPPLCIMLEHLLTHQSQEGDNEYNLILKYLSEHYLNTSMEELSKHFGRSKSHISHLFKKNCGLSIRAYCNNLKLESSKSLLLNTDFPITDIAFDSGFNDTSYFIHLFKKKFGVSPHQYRKNKKLLNV